MTRKISSIEAQLVKEQATLKTQKENLDLLRTQLKQTFDKMQAEATEKTNQEREQIKQESINLRNHYAMKEAEFTQKVNESLQSAMERNSSFANIRRMLV